MKLIPTRKQWRSWTFPSKATVVSLYLGVALALLGIAIALWPRQSDPYLDEKLGQLRSDVREDVRAEIDRLRRQAAAASSTDALRASFGDSFVMIYLDERGSDVVESPSPVNADWSRAKIIERTSETLTIALPDIEASWSATYPGQPYGGERYGGERYPTSALRIRGMILKIRNRPGNEFGLLSVPGYSVRLRVIAIGSDGVLGVIGALAERQGSPPA
jgi:hypothetical protein